MVQWNPSASFFFFESDNEPIGQGCGGTVHLACPTWSLQAWGAIRTGEDHEAGPLVVLDDDVAELPDLECDLGRDEGLCALPEVADGSVQDVPGKIIDDVVDQRSREIDVPSEVYAQELAESQVCTSRL